MIPVIHRNDAMRLIETGEPVTIRSWKLSTGDIITLRDAICVGSHWRGGTHLFRIPMSSAIRRLRDVSIFEINGMTIYM